MKLPWRAILDVLLRSKPPERPRVVEDELAKDYGDVEEWRKRGGGIAPPDAPHIDDDESTIISPQPGDTIMSDERGGKGQGQAQGQQKLHTIENAVTGEPARQITQEEWRTNGAALRAQGWTRPDDEGAEETETETGSGDASSETAAE